MGIIEISHFCKEYCIPYGQQCAPMPGHCEELAYVGRDPTMSETESFIFASKYTQTLLAQRHCVNCKQLFKRTLS